MKRFKGALYLKLALLLVGGMLQFQMSNAQYFVRHLSDSEVKKDGFFENRMPAESIEMDYVDSDFYYNRDKKQRTVGIELDFVYQHKVDIDLKDSNASRHGVEGQTWKTKISSSGASAISVQFDDFFIPEGGLMYIYSEDRKIVQGPFTSRLNKEKRSFYNIPVEGDAIFIEYFEPNNTRQKGSLKIGKVNHNYDKDLYDEVYKGADLEASEYDGLCSQKKSVCRMVKPSGSSVCTGTMLNNVEEDFTPYILTARHCFTVNPLSPVDLSYQFHLINNSYDNQISNFFTTVVYDGADLVSTTILDNCDVNPGEIDTDFILLKLINYDVNNNMDKMSAVHFAGWTREYDSSNKPEVGIALHHANGGPMEYALAGYNGVSNYGNLRSNSYVAFNCFVYGLDHPGCFAYYGCDDMETVWAASYGQGRTANVSSGCALFDINGRVLGQLFGDAGSANYDFYPRFSRSWDVAPNDPAHNLKAHLDPNNEDKISIDAICPTIVYHNHNIDANSPPVYSTIHTMELAGNIQDISYDGYGHIPDNNVPFVVAPNSDVEYKAGESICLLPGVTVENGANFIAHITSIDCDDLLDYDYYTEEYWDFSTKNEDITQTEIYAGNVKDINLNPNPAKDLVSVEFYLENNDLVSIDIIDIKGRLVKNLVEQEKYTKGSQKIAINVESIPVGTYLCKISTSEIQQVKKLIVID